MTSRVCRVCGEAKPATVEHFYPEPRVRSGFSARCRPCVAAASAAWKRAHPELAKESTRASYRRNLHAQTARVEAFYREHPEKRRAHEIARRAIRSGHIARKPCADCGATENIQAHHEDYRFALDLTFLCASCHRFRHEREKRAAQASHGGRR